MINSWKRVLFILHNPRLININATPCLLSCQITWQDHVSDFVSKTLPMGSDLHHSSPIPLLYLFFNHSKLILFSIGGITQPSALLESKHLIKDNTIFKEVMQVLLFNRICPHSASSDIFLLVTSLNTVILFCYSVISFFLSFSYIS